MSHLQAAIGRPFSELYQYATDISEADYLEAVEQFGASSAYPEASRICSELYQKGRRPTIDAVEERLDHQEAKEGFNEWLRNHFAPSPYEWQEWLGEIDIEDYYPQSYLSERHGKSVRNFLMSRISYEIPYEDYEFFDRQRLRLIVIAALKSTKSLAERINQLDNVSARAKRERLIVSGGILASLITLILLRIAGLLEGMTWLVIWILVIWIGFFLWIGISNRALNKIDKIADKIRQR